MLNRFREKDLARYEKGKDGKLFKRWLHKKEEDLNGANDKCPRCKSVAGARTGLIKKGLDHLWEEFQAWVMGKLSSEEKSDTTTETENSSEGSKGSNGNDRPPGPESSTDPGNAQCQMRACSNWKIHKSSFWNFK